MYKTSLVTEEELKKELMEANMLTLPVMRAMEYALRAHKDQKRDLGYPYLEEHIFPVALGIVNRWKNDPEFEKILLTGLLHDVVEDDPSVSIPNLERDFGPEIMGYVQALTRTPEENLSGLPQEEKRRTNVKTLESLKKGPRIPQIVKLEDRLSNISSVPAANTPKFERYLEETKNLFIPFAEELGLPYKELLQAHVDRLAS